MDPTRTHQGGCHCGAVRFEIRSDLARVNLLLFFRTAARQR